MSTFVLAVCTLIIAWLLLKPATQTSEIKEDDHFGHPLYSSFSTICFNMDNLLSQNVHNTRATVVIPLMVLDASDIFFSSAFSSAY